VSVLSIIRWGSFSFVLAIAAQPAYAQPKQPARAVRPEASARAPGGAKSGAADSGGAVATAEAPPLEKFLHDRKYREGLEWLRSFGKGTAEENRYRGLFHHGLAQPDDALRYLMPVYRARPQDEVVALAVAEASLWKKDYKTAVTIVGQLREPEAADALRVRGMVFEQAGRLKEALELYERAIPKLALPWGAMERKAQVLSWLKRFDEAASTYAKVVASKEASVELRRRCRVRMAEIAAWKKDFDAALSQLAKLLAEEPRLTDALLLKGQILEWQGEFAEAKRAYSRILEIDAGHGEARLRLNKLLWVR
jgi:tetratricopeptide (TPR) repeat protein